MKRESLVQDMENMMEIAEKTAQRTDIWQDRYIYWIAVALFHVLEWITRRSDRDGLLFVTDLIDNAPTIIPADKEGKNEN